MTPSPALLHSFIVFHQVFVQIFLKCCWQQIKIISQKQWHFWISTFDKLSLCEHFLGDWVDIFTKMSVCLCNRCFIYYGSKCKDKPFHIANIVWCWNIQITFCFLFWLLYNFLQYHVISLQRMYSDHVVLNKNDTNYLLVLHLVPVYFIY